MKWRAALLTLTQCKWACSVSVQVTSAPLHLPFLVPIAPSTTRPVNMIHCDARNHVLWLFCFRWSKTLFLLAYRCSALINMGNVQNCFFSPQTRQRITAHAITYQSKSSEPEERINCSDVLHFSTNFVNPLMTRKCLQLLRYFHITIRVCP